MTIKGDTKMKLEEIKMMISELELEEATSSRDRKDIRFQEVISLLSIKSNIDKLLDKAEREYQTAFIIDSEEDLIGNKGASTRMSMIPTEYKYVVSIILRDNSVVDIEGFNCMLEATDYADQVDYMLSDKEGRKLLRQDLGRKRGERL